MLRTHRERVPMFLGRMEHKTGQIDARVFCGQIDQVVVGKEKAVLDLWPDRVMHITLPQDTAHRIRRRAILVNVLDGGVDLENSTYTDDYPPPVIRQRRALGVPAEANAWDDGGRRSSAH